ncbi:uncharacterized protein LOC133529280 [Cydia pomonella]|uniref:uncharacterized protein LOC133525283 n=1 Tax=Cydia pomonella TaxID=82600 RepID=UPI002ADE95CD|nr:uncharacterized protein LOC133525283 [Cydia pomonella]XP_061722961.1 uncharacterized protein LOC133529280 [Cydia pomonella]
MASYSEIAETQKSLEKSVNKMLSKFEARMKSPASRATVSSLSEEFSSFKDHTLGMLKLLRSQISALSNTQDILEMRHRRKYLLFKGVPEDPGENIVSSITSIVTERLKIPDVSADSFKACHRLGKPSEGRARPILVRFADMRLKSLVWQKKTACKGSTFAISEFLTPHRQELFTQARKAFGMKSCWSLDGNIFVKLSSGVRERVESSEDIDRIKDPRNVRQSQSSSTPDPNVTEEQSRTVGDCGGQAGRSRREKPVA